MPQRIVSRNNTDSYFRHSISENRVQGSHQQDRYSTQNLLYHYVENYNPKKLPQPVTLLDSIA